MGRGMVEFLWGFGGDVFQCQHDACDLEEDITQRTSRNRRGR